MKDLYLMHHGRLGQKWGEKNGPPYPLDYRKLSPEERALAKESAIRRGDVEEANFNRDFFSDAEVRAVVQRFELNATLSQLDQKPDKIQKGLDFCTNVANKGMQVADAVDKGARIWDTFAHIANNLELADPPLKYLKDSNVLTKREDVVENGKIVRSIITDRHGNKTTIENKEQSKPIVEEYRKDGKIYKKVVKDAKGNKKEYTYTPKPKKPNPKDDKKENDNGNSNSNGNSTNNSNGILGNFRNNTNLNNVDRHIDNVSGYRSLHSSTRSNIPNPNQSRVITVQSNRQNNSQSNTQQPRIQSTVNSNNTVQRAQSNLNRLSAYNQRANDIIDRENRRADEFLRRYGYR